MGLVRVVAVEFWKDDAESDSKWRAGSDISMDGDF
jgi:hypothetical protein